MEGMSRLEPLEQSVLNTLLVARPSKCVTEERSDWKPVINPVYNFTLDGRLREGNTYLERTALGVSLDSGLMEGTSCLEPLEQSVLSSSLVTRPIECITEKVSDWKPVINPVQDFTPDGRPMEGTAYPEHSALGVSLDSGLRAGMSSIEPVRQSVLNSLLVARPVEALTETDTPERPALAPQVKYGHSKLKSSARPMLDPDQVDNADVNADVNTDLPENSAPMMNLDLRFLQLDAQSCPPGNVALDRRPMKGITVPLM